MKKLLTAILCILLVMSLVACDSEKEVTEGNQPESEKPAEPVEPSDHYPVTVTTYNYEGDEITTTYEKMPEKVLAVYQGSIETMLKLGLADNIVAAAGLDNEVSDDLKADFEKLKYLDVFTPSKEDVVMLEPDMILSWGSLFSDKNLGNVDYWIEKGCNTYINSNTRRGTHGRTLENEYTDILNLGKIFNVEDKAEAIVNEMKDEINNVISNTEGNAEKKKVLVIEPISGKITNYGADSLGGNMVESLGAELIVPGGSDIGKEDIVTANPDVIFVVYMAYSGEDGEDVKQSQLDLILKDEAFASLKAVQEGKVYPIMLGDMYASGIRTMDGISNFARGIYPELY
nr:ABC transporter substrate-binding protein [Sedimentibacter sp.]